jgi:hypothetical protein
MKKRKIELMKKTINMRKLLKMMSKFSWVRFEEPFHEHHKEEEMPSHWYRLF